jgi:WD40 repeat protein
LALTAARQLSGDPATAGTYPITVTATDSSMPPLTASAPVSLQINDSAIAIAPASPPPGTVTYAYPGFGFNATGGSPPYIWKASGTLPPGLTFGNDATVAGTPTRAGPFAFSVTATDSAQPPTSSSPLATQIMIGNPGLLALNPTPTPPAGVVGTPYGPFAFSVSGGFQPLTWSITAGGLPPGLTLGNDGSLSGTPTSPGNFMFTVTVTDSASIPVSKSLPFSITVAPPAPPVINNQEAPTGTVGVAYTPYQFTAINGLPPLLWSETGPLPTGLGVSSSGVLSGTPTAPGKYPITLDVTDALNRTAPPFPVVVRVSLPHSGSFTLLPASMTKPRSGHTATLLNTGKVLIAGGVNGVADPSAELFDPATGSFTATGNMTEARIGQSATLLNDSALANYGNVLIVGSMDTTAELYNPVTGTFAATGSMHHARTSPTATLLSNTGPNAGKVLIVGGNTTSGDLVAELYDPATGTFSETGSTTILRAGHTATLLNVGALAGQVLIAGGSDSATAELYNPATGMFTLTGSMTVARTGHTATALGVHDGTQNGDVLIVDVRGFADLYDPSTQTFTAVGSWSPPTRFHDSFAHTASLRSDGTVLAAGGYAVGCTFATRTSSNAAALFAPESDGFTATGILNTSRDTHTATVLADGSVLIVGGTHHSTIYIGFRGCFRRVGVLSSAELFK